MTTAGLVFVLAFVLNNFTPAVTDNMMGGTGSGTYYPSCTGQSCQGIVVGPGQQQQQCSKRNEVWSQCMPACEDTCVGKPADCGMGVSGCTPGCTCSPGYVRQGPSTMYDCVPRNQCPPTTGTGNTCTGPNCNTGTTCTGFGCIGQPSGSCSDPNAQFMTCGSGCPETCQGKPSMCSMNCVQGCSCKPGYVKQSNDPNSLCLLKSQCITTGPVTCTGNNCNTGNTCTGPSCYGNQQQCSKQNEVWSQCMPSCEDTCVGKPADCGMGGGGCTPGCTCAPGYVRQGPSTMYNCISRMQCPPTTSTCTGNNCFTGNTCTGPGCQPTGSCSDPNAQFTTCGSACPETCQGRQSMCSMNCVQGCFCKPGYVKQSNDPNALCLLKSQCITTGQVTCTGNNCNTGNNGYRPCTGSSCGIYPTPNNNNNYPTPNNNNACTAPNTEYSTCGSACPPTCGQRSSMCGYQCIQGCFCKSGYYRLTSATNAPCVQQSQCGGYVGRRRRFSKRV